MAYQPHPGLYIHIPFCLKKCPYCDFYSSEDQAQAPALVEALEQEMVFYKERFALFDTLYFGGGTPSVLPEGCIATIIGCARSHFSFAVDAEVTFEANPNDITPEKLMLLQGLGVNRISLGVQSFDDRALAFLGRRHTAKQARSAVALIQQAGFSQLSIDLMYGVPGQSAAGWRATAEEALSFSPEHISCYQLTVKQGTPLHDLMEQGDIKALPEQEEEALFLATAELLEGRGYSHYEISNYAREARLAARHNRKYWEHAPYLGLGPSAHSFDGGRRWWNVASVDSYIDMLQRGEAPVEGGEQLTGEQRMLEQLFLCFRTKDGMALDDLKKLPGAEAAAARLESQGLLTVRGGRAVPTRRGFLVADRLPLLLG